MGISACDGASRLCPCGADSPRGHGAQAGAFPSPLWRLAHPTRRLSRSLMDELQVPRLSAIVITRNEAANIGDCLDSVAFCEERIVVDCGSTDGTVLIAREKGARVAYHAWEGFGAQKNFALAL